MCNSCRMLVYILYCTFYYNLCKYSSALQVHMNDEQVAICPISMLKAENIPCTYIHPAPSNFVLLQTITILLSFIHVPGVVKAELLELQLEAVDHQDIAAS